MAVAHVDHSNMALAALGDFRRGERAEDGGRGGIRHRPARALLEALSRVQGAGACRTASGRDHPVSVSRARQRLKRPTRLPSG